MFKMLFVPLRNKNGVCKIKRLESGEVKSCVFVRNPASVVSGQKTTGA